MPTELGVIETASGRKAHVRVQKSSACSHCESRGACQAISDREMIFEVENSVRAKKGDRVEISVPASSLLKLSLLVYFLPIVALVAGAYAGGEFSETLGMGPTLGAIVTGAAAMCLTFYTLRRFDKKAAAGLEYSPKINRILPPLNSGNKEPECDQRSQPPS